MLCGVDVLIRSIVDVQYFAHAEAILAGFEKARQTECNTMFYGYTECAIF